MKFYIRMWWLFTRAALRTQLADSANAVLWASATLLGMLLEWATLWALFARFGSIPGWDFASSSMLFGLVRIAFGIAEMIGRGFDRFHHVIRKGDFDRMLLRPIPVAIQLSVAEFSRFGMIGAGAVAFIYGCSAAHVSLNLVSSVYLAAVISGGAALFYGLLMMQATLCFWTVDGIEVANAVVYGGQTAAQLPLDKLSRPLTFVFTYVFPLAIINWIPAKALLTGEFTGLALAAPLIGWLFFGLGAFVWKIGVRAYTSTGS